MLCRFRPPLCPFQFRLQFRHNISPFRSIQGRFVHRQPNRRPGYQRFENASRFAGRIQMLQNYQLSRSVVTYVCVGAAGVFWWNLEKVPVSGRQRFNFISPAWEAKIGEHTVNEIKQEYGDRILPPYEPVVRQIQGVMDRLLPFATKHGLKETSWEIYVIDDENEINAFVVPGGKVFIFTGILPICKDENGVAAVLGHELAHVVAHHTAESMSKGAILLIPIIGLAYLLDVSANLSASLISLFFKLPASRRHEAEADYIGLMMMAQACYDPESAKKMWGRMEQMAKSDVPQMLSTHPSNHNRIAKITEWMPKAMEEADKSNCGGISGYADHFRAVFGKATRSDLW